MSFFQRKIDVIVRINQRNDSKKAINTLMSIIAIDYYFLIFASALATSSSEGLGSFFARVIMLYTYS